MCTSTLCANSERTPREAPTSDHAARLHGPGAAREDDPQRFGLLRALLVHGPGHGPRARVLGLPDVARHVIDCRVVQETRVQHTLSAVASNKRQAQPAAGSGQVRRSTPSSMNKARSDGHPYTTPPTSVVIAMAYGHTRRTAPGLPTAA